MDAILSLLSNLFWLAVILVGIGLFSYNKLQRLSQGIREASSNVQVAVSKKLSLVNQLMDVARGYLESEQFTMLKISQDSSPSGMMAAYQQSGAVLTTLQGMAERFPDLKANAQFLRLMDGIHDCEGGIQKQREAYNAAVKGYNAVCLSIPTVFVARFIGFSAAPYLEFDHSGLKDVTSLKEFKTDDGERLKQLLDSAGSHLVGATKTLATQATQAGRAFGEKVREVSEKQERETGAPAYFYRIPPDGVPVGPANLAQIHEMSESGQLPANVLIAEAGQNAWKTLEDVQQA